MEGRVARVDVMTNRDKEVGAGILASSLRPEVDGKPSQEFVQASAGRRRGHGRRSPRRSQAAHAHRSRRLPDLTAPRIQNARSGAMRHEKLLRNSPNIMTPQRSGQIGEPLRRDATAARPRAPRRGRRGGWRQCQSRQGSLRVRRRAGRARQPRSALPSRGSRGFLKKQVVPLLLNTGDFVVYASSLLLPRLMQRQRNTLRGNSPLHIGQIPLAKSEEPLTTCRGRGERRSDDFSDEVVPCGVDGG